MSRYLDQAAVHALVGALFVELLARAWGERDPAQRMRLRLVALVAALVAGPALDAMAPLRREEPFAEQWALLVGRRWAAVDVAGVSLRSLFLGALAAAGGALFLRDLLPFLRRVLRARPALAAPDPRLRSMTDELGGGAVQVVVLERPAPVMLASGVWRPRIAVSRGTLELLDEGELRAALEHELGHVKRRDAAWSWALFAARVAQAWNPAVQLLARAVARDVERRADDRAHDRVALASAIVKLHRSAGGGAEPLWGPFLARARAAAVADRCRRLLDGPPPAADPFAWVRLLAATAALAGLLFLVV